VSTVEEALFEARTCATSFDSKMTGVGFDTVIARVEAKARADLLDELNLKHLEAVQFANGYHISAVPQADILGLRNEERSKAQ